MALLTSAVVIVIVGTVIPLATIACTTGVVTALQSVLQIQEQSVVHLVRVVTIGVLLYFVGPLFFGELLHLLQGAIRLARLL